METTSSPAATSSRKFALFIVNTLTPAAHNNPQYRVASELCPGKRGCEWRAGELAGCGYADMLRIQLAQLMAESGIEGVKKECNWKDVCETAENGHLDVIRELLAYGIHCTSLGADMAALRGHLDVIHDLRAHDIHCTSRGVEYAAKNGHLDVIRDLRTHNIHCTSFGADWAARNGHLEVVRDLQARGIIASKK